ncbi:MAG: 16S rRNA (guanine(527)-N(7))-methyltransferase RsmG [bacterium]
MFESLKHAKVGSELIPELLRSLPEDFRLDDHQVHQFGVYLDLILQWNSKAGLMSSADEDRLIKRHIVESLGVLSLKLLWPSAEVLDLGTGGGFPGIPVKIAMPSLMMTLLDSRRMKGLFLEEVVRTLALVHTQVVNDRAERVKERLASRYDFVLARAVSDLKTLWSWSSPLLKRGGSLLAQKGGDLETELNQLLHSYSKLHPQQIQYPKNWDIEPSRCIIVLEKE